MSSDQFLKDYGSPCFMDFLRQQQIVLVNTVSILDTMYPHVASKIMKFWSEPELMIKYFDSLLMNNRDDGTERNGFDVDAMSEIMNLYTQYSSIPTLTSRVELKIVK